MKAAIFFDRKANVAKRSSRWVGRWKIGGPVVFFEGNDRRVNKAKKCREYTNARLREFPRKTNRRDFRRANADRFTSVKRLWRPKKISYTEPRIRRPRPSSDRSECR